MQIYSFGFLTSQSSYLMDILIHLWIRDCPIFVELNGSVQGNNAIDQSRSEDRFTKSQPARQTARQTDR